ncbi:MAG: hypothetical protein M3328_03355 [Chloroflexota bacterium]|nr:hypothetical protein [Chloroflexota bacterium]
MATRVAATDTKPRSTNKPTFDPDRLAHLEVAGFRAYYDRKWLRCFRLLAQLAHEQFHLSLPRAIQAAYYITRASIAWAPVDHDTRKVRLYIRKFYRVAVKHGKTFDFDPDTVARLEYIYWDEHRKLSGRPQSEKAPLIQSLTDLHAAIFNLTPEAALPSAIDRARCTDTVDEITGHRSTDIEADWRIAEDYLRTAYRSIAAKL